MFCEGMQHFLINHKAFEREHKVFWENAKVLQANAKFLGGMLKLHEGTKVSLRNSEKSSVSKQMFLRNATFCDKTEIL